MNGIPWTPDEDARLRGLYPTRTAAEVAAALGRTVSSVHRHAALLGLKKHPHWLPQVLAKVWRLNGEGLCDRAIAEAMAGVFAAGTAGVYQVKSIRQRLKLPWNPDRDAKRRSIENQRKTLGIRHGGDLRALAYRRFAARNGWPEDLPPRCVQVLNLLCERGPMTLLQLAGAMGTRTDKRNAVHGGPSLLACNPSPTYAGGGSYTGLLLRRGLICSTSIGGGPGSGKGRGRKGNVYAVTLAAIHLRQEFIRGQEQRDAGPPHEPVGHAARDGARGPAAERGRGHG